MNNSHDRRARRLDFQKLEPRKLLAADLGAFSSVQATDVTADTEVVNIVQTNQAPLESSLPTFSKEPGYYQIFSSFGRTGKINVQDGTFDTAQFNAGTKVNAAGYRQADDYAYGIMTGTYDLARIGGNGQIENLGTIEGLMETGSYYVGDFADDGLLYVRGSHDLRTLLGIDIDLQQVTNTIRTTTHLTNIYDIAFNNVDQKFYASQRGAENALLSIDLDGTVNRIGENGLSKLTFGAMYADGDGNVFGGANQTGDVYRFDTDSGAATRVAQGPISGTNDGFSNASQVVELPPLAVDDFFETENINASSGNLFADTGNGADTDGNRDSISVVSVEGSAANVGQLITLDSGSKVVVDAEGNYQYKPSAMFKNLTVNQRVTESFNYTIADTSGLSDVGTVEFKVSGIKESTVFEGVRVTGFDGFGGKNVVLLESVGDVNGDGFEDGIASSSSALNARGVTAVVYGSADGFQSNFNINSLREVNGGDGSNGALFFGVNANDLSGASRAEIGDFNGDGVDDFAIGAKDADPNGVKNAGETYVVFGSRTGFGAEFELGRLKASAGGDGSEGFVLEGVNAHDLSGGAVSGVGDFNADGLNDIVLAAKFADVDANRRNAGQVFVVYGTRDAMEAQVSLNAFTRAGGNDGSRGVVFNGMRKHDLAGTEVSTGGDFNGDGIDDLIVTAKFGDSHAWMVDVGQSYVIYGRSDLGAEFELSALLESNGSDGTHGFVIHGSERFKNAGSYVSMIRDLNGDGRTELSVGAFDPNSTDTHLILGGSLESEIELVDLASSHTVLVDNFDRPDDIYSDRDWDRFSYNVTMHSDNDTQVTIWGDPHVIVKMDGLTRRFDIGLGEQTVELKNGTTLNWNTADANLEQYPLGPPLTYFSIDSEGAEHDHLIDMGDELNFIDAETGLTEGELREFAHILYQMRVR